MKKDTAKIEVSYKTIVFTVAFLTLMWILYQIRDLVLEFFVALLLSAILNPLVTNLGKLKLPRSLAIILVYVFLISLVSFIVAVSAPPVIEQTTVLVNRLPLYSAELKISSYIKDPVIDNILSYLGSLPTQVIKIIFSFFGNLLSVLTVLIFTFYLLISRQVLEKQLYFLFGNLKGKKVYILIENLEKKLGGWARAQLMLMLLVGVLTYIGLLILNFPFALSLSLLAGLLEIIPYLGPILAAIPTVIVGFSLSPIKGVLSLILVFLVQQIENYVFVPKVMEKTTGVPPIITLLALAVGLRLAGVVGALISLPSAIALKFLIEELVFFSRRRV